MSYFTSSQPQLAYDCVRKTAVHINNLDNPELYEIHLQKPISIFIIDEPRHGWLYSCQDMGVGAFKKA